MLFGRVISVEIQPHLMAERDIYGAAEYMQRRISLQEVNSLHTPEGQAETFCHELVHYLFHAAYERELRDNERLVEVVGALLYQALSTMEYE